MDFTGRQIVVTGGTGALGRAVVGTLIKSGATCHVSYMLEAEAQSFPHKQNVTLHAVNDLADEATVGKLYANVPKLWASIHLAGGFAANSFADTDKAKLMQQLETNFIACFLCCRAAVKAMGRNGGRIVNVAARPALEWRSGAGMVAYASSKAAVAAMTVALAEEAVKDGILVNAVAPSTMDTPANRKAMPNADVSKWVQPVNVARLVTWLAGDAGKDVNGAAIPVYGAEV